MRVDIDAMDGGRVVNHVIQRIATGARDHHDTVLGADIQNRVVHCRIFPTLVVNEISRVDLVKQPSREGYPHDCIFNHLSCTDINDK
jgi:hypothetical protein